MSANLKKKAKLERMVATSNHSLYRVFALAGQRDSRVYDGTGIEKTFELSNVDHEYPNDPNAVPVLKHTEIGEVMEKDVEVTTVTCEDCGTPNRLDERSIPVCPECGLISGGKNREQMVYDKPASGRTDTYDK